MNLKKTIISQPIFLVGSERSGTTLLRLMLDNHRNIAWCEEFEYAVDQISDNGTFPDLNQYYEWLKVNRIFQASGFVIDESLNYPELMNSFLNQRLEKKGKSIIGATVHRGFDHLLKIWPDAYFIHLVRDPRDVARSCIKMGWAGNVYFGVERWIQVEQLWDKVSTSIPATNKIEIFYEELIINTTRTLTEICNFIRVDFDEQMLSYAQNSTYGLPDQSLIQQWKSQLSANEIQLVETHCQELLQKRNYTLSNLKLLSINSLVKFQLKLQNWLVCKSFAIKRYGVGLFVAYFLARKLKLKNWEKYFKLKLNHIDNLYLQ